MNTFKKSFIISIIFLIICGFIYPLLITGISQVAFNHQANGSIIKYNGKEAGSELLGQKFVDNRFLHGRISNVDYNTYKGKELKNGVSSGSSNLGPSNPELKTRVKRDIAEFLSVHKGIKRSDIPTDLLTSSASGLDPDISPKAAEIQLPLISKTTGLSMQKLKKIVSDNTQGRSLGIFGEKRVNVLKTNIDIAKAINYK